MSGKAVGQGVHQLVAVLGTIHAPALIFLDVEANHPVAQGQAGVDSTAGLRRQFVMHKTDRTNQLPEVQIGWTGVLDGQHGEHP